MSDIRFNCPSCKQSLDAPPDMLGELIDCPSCKNTIEVSFPPSKLVAAIKSQQSKKVPSLRSKLSLWWDEQIQQLNEAPSWGEEIEHFINKHRTISGGNAHRSRSKKHGRQTQGDLKMVLGIVGSLILILGVFSPLVSHVSLGTVNYFKNGTGDGVIILILAFISLLLSASRKYRGLWFTGLCSAACLCFTFVDFQRSMDKMKSELIAKHFVGLADRATDAFQMQWGWAVLISGIALILVAAAIEPQTDK